MSFARSDCLPIKHKKPKSILIGILNRECVVQSTSNNVASIPNEVVAKTI